MDRETDIRKYERWLTQLCRELRPEVTLSVAVEQVETPIESYTIRFYRRENGVVVNERSVTISRSDVDDLSAGQKLVAAIREV